MSTKHPVYREKGRVYHSDSCEPLIKAWKAGKIELQALARLDYPGYEMREDVLVGINTIGFWNARNPQDWGLDWHRNEGIEITYLETGNVVFELEDHPTVLNADDLTITRPWQLHKVGGPSVGVGKLHWLILDVNVRQPHQEWKWPAWIMLTKDDLAELSKMLRQNEQPVLKSNTGIRRCFQQIGQLITNDANVVNESWIKIYVNELLMHMLSMFRQGGFQYNESLTDSSRSIELFIKELDELYHQPWTLESMADHCGLGVTRFVHYFKQLVNRTPMQHLNYVRLTAAARQLIKNPSARINQVGYECGFSSSQYFTTLFRKQFGATPADYAQEHKKSAGVTLQ